MTHMLTIQYRTATALESNDSDSFLLNVLEETISLRELIRRTVHEEIRIRDSKNKVAETQTAEILSRKFLASDEIDRQSQTGKVGLPKPLKPKVFDLEKEAKRACQAFEDGVFLVLLNDQRIESLSTPLTFHEQNQVTYIRLMPLVGG